MSYRENLLAQEAPLDPHEVEDLRRWLEVLSEDCDAFGPTPEDEARMAAIERKIAGAAAPRPD